MRPIDLALFRAAPFFLIVAALVLGGVSCDAPRAPAPSTAKPAPPTAEKVARADVDRQLPSPTVANPQPTPPKASAAESKVEVSTSPAKLAEQLCSAALKTPQILAARCCKRRATKVDVTPCTTALAAALSSKRASASGVSRCFFDLEEALDGCDWVGGEPPLPLSCRGMIESTQKAGDACAHSIECTSGRCADGVCGPRDDVETCTDFLGAFAANACAANERCDDGQCLPACSPPCHAGERCAAGKCEAQKAPGQPCASDDECVGACFEGLCAMRCDGIGGGQK